MTTWLSCTAAQAWLYIAAYRLRSFDSQIVAAHVDDSMLKAVISCASPAHPVVFSSTTRACRLYQGEAVIFGMEEQGTDINVVWGWSGRRYLKAPARAFSEWMVLISSARLMINNVDERRSDPSLPDTIGITLTESMFEEICGAKFTNTTAMDCMKRMTWNMLTVSRGDDCNRRFFVS